MHWATIATLAGVALERMHYVEVARRTSRQIDSEQLRNALLSAVSHDLRTPLTALVGWTDVLLMSAPPLDPKREATARRIAAEARRTHRLVDNLLEMARLQATEFAPRLQWESLEEIVGEQSDQSMQRSRANGSGSSWHRTCRWCAATVR
jgi:two-component system sensor histidine kinase KdpD